MRSIIQRLSNTRLVVSFLFIVKHCKIIFLHVTFAPNVIKLEKKYCILSREQEVVYRQGKKGEWISTCRHTEATQGDKRIRLIQRTTYFTSYLGEEDSK